MRFATETFGAVASLALLTACGAGGGERPTSAIGSTAVAPETVVDGPAVLGAPYTESGVTYTPQDSPLYDEVGYAGIVDADRIGKSTVTGEIYSAASISAAHRTLPVPSYVEVTALDSGRTILVRVNDRGPVPKDNVVQISEGAAQQLGLTGTATTAVRVRRVNPPEQEKAVLRIGARATERIETPEQLLKVLRTKIAKPTQLAVEIAEPAKPVEVVAKPEVKAKDVKAKAPVAIKAAPVAKKAPEVAKPKPVSPVAGSFFVQVAAFSSRARADALAQKLGGIVSAQSSSGLFRVRIGPLPTKAEADQKLAAVQKNGHPTARIYRE